MRPFVALLRIEARNALSSLAAAGVASVALLGAIHVWFPMRAEPALTGIAILVAAWAAYFAADSFATDCSSGRMETKACLPVSAVTLWAAKIVFLAAVLAALAAWTVGSGFIIQATLGSPASRETFADKLPEMFAGLPLLALLAATGVLCSMLVEGALVATLLTAIVAAVLGGLAVWLGRILPMVGIEWRLEDWLRCATVLAALLIGCSAVAFDAGQRRMGSRAARAKVTFGLVAAWVAAGGIAGASATWLRFSAGLEHPRMRFVRAAASEDGRWLALEGYRDLSGNDDPPTAVWVVEVDSGEARFVARIGTLKPDRYTFTSLPWSDVEPLPVIRCTLLDPRKLAEVVGVHAGPTLSIGPLEEGLAPRTRVIGEWAEISVKHKSQIETTVRWKDRGLELCFRGSGIETAPARGVLPGPVPGRILAVEGGRVVIHDMQDGSKRTVFEGGVLSLWPSSDGSAVLVHGDRGWAALSSADGSLLHDPWSGRQNVRWVDSNAGGRVVEIAPVGVVLSRTTILDLDTARVFEIERDHGQWLLHRLADRGYVFVDRRGDVVWVDPQGKLVKVLVDR